MEQGQQVVLVQQVLKELQVRQVGQAHKELKVKKVK